MSRQHENTITTKLVDILNKMRSTWTLAEQARPFKNNQKCPDVFVTELGREPVAIEVKLDGKSPNTRGEAQIREKLCAEPSIHGGKKSRCDLEAEQMKFGM